MTPQELKNSILQLAIQGKLVEQRPEEGTAAELLQKIFAAKATKVGSRVPRDRKIGACGRAGRAPLPPIPDDEKPFDIPESWEWVRLGDVGSWASGATPSRTQAEYYGGNIPWLKTGDLNDGYVSSIPETITDLALEKSSVRLNPVGSVLMAMYGATIGKLGILQVTATTNQACCACIPYDGVWNKYLFYFLMARRRAFIKMGEGGAQPNISKEKIINAVIPLPPLAEQKRIVAKIEELLPLIDRYEKAWSKLEDFNRRFPVDMQKSVLQMAIQGKLVDQRPEEGTGEELLEKILATKNTKGGKKSLTRSRGARGEKTTSALSASTREEISDDEKSFVIPESWKWVRLGDIASVLGGKRIPAGRQLTTENTGHIYIRVSDMKNDGVNMERLMYVPPDIYPSISRYIIKKEDVYITVAGTIGRIGKIPPELDGANLTENADRLVFEGIDQQWLIQCLKSALVQTQILECTTQVGQPKLAIKRIQGLVIPLPPLAEQKRIVVKLEEILPLCERLK